MKKNAPVDLAPIRRAIGLIDDAQSILDTVAEEYYGRGNRFVEPELFKCLECIDLAQMEVEFFYDEIKAHLDEKFEPPIG